MSNPTAQMHGIVCILVAGLCLTVQDAIVKWLSDDYSVGQIMSIRGGFALLFGIALIWRDGGSSILRVQHIPLQVLRALCVIGTTVTFVTAIRFMPLATAITISFAGPLFLTALAPRFLGEHIGWRRWVAVSIGFLGVIVIFRPGSGTLDWVMLLPLSTAVIGAVRDIAARKLSAHDHRTATAFYAMLGVTLAGLFSLPWSWSMPVASDWGLFAITGLLIGAAQILMVQAFHYGEVSTIVPFRYFSVLWGSIIGYLVWGDMPDDWAMAGGMLIIASGLYILRREAIRKRN